MRDTWCIYKPEEMPANFVMILAGIPSESDDYNDDDVLAEEKKMRGGLSVACLFKSDPSF